MARCRACKRIAQRRKRLGYWRPFVLFSIAAHLCATAAFSQLSMSYNVPSRHADISFVQLVKNSQDPAHATASGKKISGPAHSLARKKAQRQSGNEAAERIALTGGNRGPLKPAPVSSEARDGKMDAAASAPAKESGGSAPVNTVPRGGILIIKDVKKEIVMPDIMDAGAAVENAPVIKIRAADDISPLAGHSIDPVSEEETQAVSAIRASGAGKIDIADDKAEDLTADPEPVFSIADAGGIATEVPPQSLSDTSPGIKIVHPGRTTDESTVEVSGTVSGVGINYVNVLVNGALWETPVKDGTFKTTVSLREGMNEIDAAAADASGRRVEDNVTVTYRPADIVVHLECPAGCRLAYKWAPHPLGIETGSPSPDEFNLKEDVGSAILSLRHAAPGIYTVMLGYDSSEPMEVSLEATLCGNKTRSYGPLKVRGKGRLAAVRILMPEGIFWDEDAWFSGIITGGSYTTKYKMPEGIIWKEEE